MLNSTKTLFGIALCLGTAACGSDAPMNIGDIGVTGEKLSDYAGTWEGYSEASEFADGSDRVRIVLDANGVGVIELGGDVTPPYPTIVTEPGAFPFETGNTADVGHHAPFSYQPAPGYSFPIESANVETHRIRFDANLLSPFESWCAGFTPISDEASLTPQEPHYSCYANIGGGLDENGCYLGDGVETRESINCQDLACREICECDANACSIPENEVRDFRFDGALEDMGEALVGTLVVGEHVTVRLTRQ